VVLRKLLKLKGFCSFHFCIEVVLILLSRTRMHRVAFPLLVVVAVVLGQSEAHAGSILFSAKGAGEEGVNLSASALFTVNGSTLTIRLRNTGDSSGAGLDLPSNLLSGVFFDLPTGVALTPFAATVTPGAILQPWNCDPGKCNGSTTNVGGEFAYNTSSADWSGNHAGNHGIAGSGYIGVNKANFNGPDLDAPANPNGPNFGITSAITDENWFNPNGGLQGEPLIEKEVIFTLSITKNNKSYTDLALSQISNVSFQYGTGFGQPKLPPGLTPPPGVPEPASLLLLVPGMAWAVRRQKSKAAHRV
jgi:hypothetical protein